MTGEPDDARGRPFAYAPLVAGGLAVPYQLRVNGVLLRDLRLSGPTLAKIFLGQITNVVAAGSSNGAIGYDEYSYALGAGYPVAKVGNAAGYYIAPDPLNVSLSLTRATLNPDLTANLDGVYAFEDPRAYPLSGYTYLILPTGADDARMTTAKRQTLVNFFAHTACTGQAGVSVMGYAPLPLNMVRAQFDQLRKLHDADPAVDVSTLDPAHCANPTFIPGDLTRDVPVQAQNDATPYAGGVVIQVALGSRVSLTQVDPASPGGHPAQATPAGAYDGREPTPIGQVMPFGPWLQ
ncbi:substrate-binding domain-containing protein [Dactylosporangium sp. NBC_01737]|uniref:hypothetical protein n=1 Tax=Dactylosporangium sp. NBC_01737 TaxID=2975959 RepID=UPI002E0F4F1C|nr:substrate-binding domain-containing protein [Dactylosporangium sp. NBC_01737]